MARWPCRSITDALGRAPPSDDPGAKMIRRSSSLSSSRAIRSVIASNRPSSRYPGTPLSIGAWNRRPRCGSAARPDGLCRIRRGDSRVRPAYGPHALRAARCDVRAVASGVCPRCRARNRRSTRTASAHGPVRRHHGPVRARVPTRSAQGLPATWHDIRRRLGHVPDLARKACRPAERHPRDRYGPRYQPPSSLALRRCSLTRCGSASAASASPTLSWTGSATLARPSSKPNAWSTAA